MYISDRRYLNFASLLSLLVVQDDNIENGSGSLKQNRTAVEHQASQRRLTHCKSEKRTCQEQEAQAQKDSEEKLT